MYEELKKLAENATQGPWQAYDTHGKRFIESMHMEAHVVSDRPTKQWLKDSEFIAAANPSAVLALIADLPYWYPMDICPRHTDVLFYRADAGVFPGQFTYCETFMSEKEIEESDYDEQTLYAEDVFSFGPDGAYRCDGDLVPTHWMPFPVEPSE